MWCIPTLDDEYIERMEDLLRLYARPYSVDEVSNPRRGINYTPKHASWLNPGGNRDQSTEPSMPREAAPRTSAPTRSRDQGVGACGEPGGQKDPLAISSSR